ncbi:MAG: hypothetical protein QCH35_09075 [Methanomicrobiaceae archaeon]|nr:hypothetical protein [Methanomicrobiaceae archaeon]
MHREELQKFAQQKYAWLLVPAISFGGIALRYLGDSLIIGIAGCVLGSFILGALAYLKPRRDIVSLLAPLYAVIIFYGLENAPNDYTVWLFAASISILALRLEKRFSSA